MFTNLSSHFYYHSPWATGHFSLPNAAGQKGLQCVVEWLIGRQHLVVDTVTSCPLAQLLNVRIDRLPIAITQQFGEDVNLIPGFEILEQGGVGKVEVEFLPVEQMEDNNVVTAKPQVLEGLDEGVWLIIEI